MSPAASKEKVAIVVFKKLITPTTYYFICEQRFRETMVAQRAQLRQHFAAAALQSSTHFYSYV